MRTELIKSTNLAHAADLLRLGKLVAFPTDTFFALGAVLQEDAIEKLFDAKGRMAGNPVPVLLSSTEQVSHVASTEITGPTQALADAYWPGPLTLVLTAKSGVPAAVTASTGNVGVRVPDHELARSLIELVGSPVTGTSANLSGGEPCKTAKQVLSQLNGIIDTVVDAPCGAHASPSTVVSVESSAIRVLREGSISESEIRRTAGLS